ncbi:MAG TPA: NUDIX domain-containing protein [Sphingobacteriaceae bacterium]
MANIKILERETLSDKKYRLENIRFNITDSAGKEQEQSREIYFRPDGAVLLLYNLKNKTMLFTRQFRLVAGLRGPENEILEACAGIIDPGESPEEAAIREGEEELGYRVDSVEKIMSAYSTPGGVTEMIHFFIGEYHEGMKVNGGGGVEHEGEDIEIVELTFEQVRTKLKNKEFNDAKTIILLQHLQIKGIL